MKYPFSIIFPKRIGEISDFTLTVNEGAVMFGNRRYSLTSDNSGGFTAKYKQSGRPDEDALKTKAIPHKDCGTDTQSDFSSDCPNLPQEY